MDIEALSSGFYAMLLASPNIENLVSRFPGEEGDVPAIFRNRAPQEARTPYIVWHHVTTPVRYDSCGEVVPYDSMLQLDFHAQDLEELDEMFRSVCEHVSFLSGPFADIDVGAVFVGDAGDEDNEDIETNGDITSPIRRLDLKIHWTPNH